MARMFVNRRAELDALDSWWTSPTGRAGLVWGRRRVGKTALLQRFAADRRAVFHTGAGRPRAGELEQLTRQVAAEDVTGMRDLVSRPYVSWDDAFDDLAQRAADRPLLLVLDEFPEIVRTAPELPGVLRAFLDRAAGRTRLRILLCGSAVRVMTALAEERAPLYGRFDLTLHLHPFGPGDASLMLPGLPATERALVHGLLGGMPLYLSWWDQSAGPAENLERLACRPGAPLLTEGQLVLATEAEAGEQPAAVLHAIAAGRSRHNEIKSALGAEPSRTLDRLVELRLVERLRPVTDPERSRQRHYRIADHFLAFYLGVLSRYRAEIDRGLGPSVLPILMEHLDDHMGRVWEDAFRTYVREGAAHGRWPEGLTPPGEPVVAVGPWWSTDGTTEVDMVALGGRARMPVLVGEAKWAPRVGGARLAQDLARAAERVPGVGDGAQLGLVLCARSRVDAAPPGVGVVTAADMYPGPVDLSR
jgi:hypothetical protein